VALAKLIDNAGWKASVASTTGAIIERSERLLATGFYERLVDSCKVLRQISLGLLELPFEPSQLPVEQYDSLSDLGLHFGTVLFDHLELTFQSDELALQGIDALEKLKDLIGQYAVCLSVSRKLILDGLVLSIVRRAVEFALPLIEFGFVLTLLELLAVGLHSAFLDCILASRNAVASLLGFRLGSFDLLGRPFDLTADIRHLEQDFVKSANDRIAYWHRCQTLNCWPGTCSRNSLRQCTYKRFGKPGLLPVLWAGFLLC